MRTAVGSWSSQIAQLCTALRRPGLVIMRYTLELVVCRAYTRMASDTWLLRTVRWPGMQIAVAESGPYDRMRFVLYLCVGLQCPTDQMRVALMLHSYRESTHYG